MDHCLIKTYDKIVGPSEIEIVLSVELPSLLWADLLKVACEYLSHPES